MVNMHTLTDTDVARILRHHGHVHVVGDATDYARLAAVFHDPPPAEPLPAWCAPEGVFVAHTETDDDGHRWRRWRWEPDAQAWERDARAAGKLT